MKQLHEVTRDDVERALNERGSVLSERSERVIRMLYGLTPDGKQYSTLQLADEEFHLPRVRILQVRELALRQLKLIAPEGSA
jgi:DNA-directed RNA polymerase sigma subunit (sigma70/sigma32)